MNAVILALIIWVMAQIFTLLVRNRSSLDPPEAFSEDRASRQVVFVVALAAPLLLVVSPAMIESSGVVSNDLAAVLTSAACAWLYLRCQTAEPNTKLTTISGFGIGGVMALTKATTLVPVCVLAFLALVSLLSSERRRSDRQSLLFSFSVALSWVACTVGWSMLVDRLTRVPIKSLLVFQLWREPLPTVAWRAAKGIPLLALRGAFGANADSVAFRLAEGLGWVLLLALPIAATAMIATRSRGSWQVAGIAAGVWCAGPVMALGTYLGTGKPHVDSRLLLSAVPWVLIALSISAQTAIHFRRSAVVALVTAATCTSLALISYGAYLVPLLT